MKRSPPRLVLFDVDGTLIDSGGAGRAALDAAFLEIWALPDATAGVTLAGGLDPELVREVMTGPLGLRPDRITEQMVTRVLQSYLRHLPGCLLAAAGYRVLPGVQELLNDLLADPRVDCGLVTGNVPEGARLKLAKGALDQLFKLGAYGGDAPLRAGLVEVAIARAGQVLGGDIARDRVILVGDTVRDVEAARVAGVGCLAVATGPESEAGLRAAGAEQAVASLESADARARLLTPGEWI